MLENVKDNLRIRHSALDLEITGTIDAAKADLERVGVVCSPQDPLIEQAIKLYCRWAYNFENQADRYLSAYENLRNVMSLDMNRREPDV